MIRTLTPAALMLLAACGGGDTRENAPNVPHESVILDRSTAAAGDPRTGAGLLVLVLPGPVVDLPAPGTVTVNLAGYVTVTQHYPARVTAGLAMRQPFGTFPSVVPLAAGRAELAYSVAIAMPAGRTQLSAAITLLSVDPDGTPTGAMGRAETAVDWTVTKH